MMKNKDAQELFGKLWTTVKKNKFVMAVVLLGLVLILLPTRSQSAAKTTEKTTSTTEFSLAEQESHIAAALSKIEGAGKVTVVLSLKRGTEQVLAKDESESGSVSGTGDQAENKTERSSTTVIVSTGSSTETPITLQYIYPEYLGALIVCEGAGNAAVKYEIVSAVSGLTGLGTDKVVVTKMNKS